MIPNDSDERPGMYGNYGNALGRGCALLIICFFITVAAASIAYGLVKLASES